MFSRFRELFGTQDMTVGRPVSVMMKFAIPMLIGNFAQMAYNTVNSVVLGQFVSPEALGAVGASTPILNMFFVFFMTVSVGVSVVVSQYFGAKDREHLSKSVGTSLILTLIATLFITVVGVPLARPILRLTKVDASMIDFASQYLTIMLAGTIGQGFYNILSGILRGMGESIFPLLILLFTSALNIALALLFVGPLGMGVAGAALATVVSQLVSAVACLFRLRRMRDTVELSRRTVRLDGEMTRQVLRIGLPSGVMQSILMLSYVLVQSLTNSIIVFDALGVASATIFVACNTALSSIDSIAQLPLQAFSNASSTFVAQNIGAGKMDRVTQSFRITLLISLGVAAVLIVGVLTFSSQLMGMFIDKTHQDYDIIVSLGQRMLWIIVWNFITMAIMQSASGILRGAGDTLPIMWSTIIATVPLRLPIAYLMVHLSKSAEYPAGNPAGIHLSYLLCFAVAMLGCMIRYKSGKWKDKAVITAKAAQAELAEQEG